MGGMNLCGCESAHLRTKPIEFLIRRQSSVECDTRSIVSEYDETLPLSAHDLVQLFDGIADAVLVQDRDGTIVFANDTAARLCGKPSAAVMLGKPIGDVLRGFEIRDEAAAPFLSHYCPRVASLPGSPRLMPSSDTAPIPAGWNGGRRIGRPRSAIPPARYGMRRASSGTSRIRSARNWRSRMRIASSRRCSMSARP